MSVDTYLTRKNLSTYHTAHFEDVKILVSSKLSGWAKALSISSRRHLFWKRLDIKIAPLRPHVHGAA